MCRTRLEDGQDWDHSGEAGCGELFAKPDELLHSIFCDALVFPELMKRLPELAKRLVYVAGLLVVLCVIFIYTLARASLPQLEGTHVLNGLSAEVTVDRDELGVPTITGNSRVDVARATGFVHAQDRFFQMDLMRRRSAGELSALFGEAALPVDRRHRRHRLRGIAVKVVEGLTTRHRELLAAYAEGVNEGLKQLPSRPPEYWIISASPEPWRVEDSILVVHSMYLELNDEEATLESKRSFLRDCLPTPAADFLTSADASWAAPLDGGPLASIPLPDAATYDLRKLIGVRFVPPRMAEESPHMTGGNSNGWAVSGKHTESGSAIVANDMHLALRLPNTWYRMRLSVPGARPSIDVTGVTLPGVPLIVAGSNGRVAWGFTNSYGDWTDRVQLELDPKDSNRYLTSDGYRKFTTYEEPIKVQGAEDVVQAVRYSLWGPVINDHHGEPVSIKWLAHEPAATNLELIQMEQAEDVIAALRIASESGLPPQNFVAGDTDGHIGWTIAGRIPRRRGLVSGRSANWAHGDVGWFGWVEASEYPTIVDPPSGYIWTANQQVVTGRALETLGDGGYLHGARARQIRDSLFALQRASIQDMLQIQLDDRALLMERWHLLLLDLLDPAKGGSIHPRAEEFRSLLQDWDGRASVNSVAYRLVRAFRKRVRDVVLSALAAPCRLVDPDFDPAGFPQEEGPLWELIRVQPIHLLNPGFQSWTEQLRHLAGETIAFFDTHFEGPFQDRTWGEHNTVSIRHPLSPALPALLGSWLDLPVMHLSGDIYVPRRQTVLSGPSERFAVAPGREAKGYFHMPGGQSGHPLSSFYRKGHESWVRGEPLPFLPGATEYSLKLIPPEGADR